MTNGYEIRLELLKMAKEMLEQNWHAKRDLTLTEFNNKVSLVHAKAENMGWDKAELPPSPSFDPFPTESEIIAKATVLNQFINQRS